MRLRLIFIFLILFSGIAQASIEVQRETNAPSETVIAEINKQDFRLSDLTLLYNSTTVIRTGIILVELGDDNYVAYFNLLPSMELGNYELKMVNESAFFSISGSNISLALRPPVAWLEDKGTFSISLTNPGKEALEVNVEPVTGLTPARPSISLLPGEKKNLFVQYDASLVEADGLKLSYGDKGYSIRLLKIEKEVVEEEEEEVQKPKKGLTIDTKEIIQRTTVDEALETQVSFRNLLDTFLHNATFHVSEELAYFTDFKKAEFPLLKPNKSYTQTVSFNTETNVKEGIYKGIVLVDCAEGYSASIPLELTFTKVEEPIEPVVEEEEPNITEIEPFNLTGFNYSDIPGKEEPKRNYTLGIVLSIVLLIILGFLTYKLWPRKVKKKFKDLIKR